MRQPVHVDKALAKRILQGDEKAFRRLFDDFFPKLYRFAMARLDGDHAAGRDVVQETFCKSIERLDSYRGEAALYTWFCQICRNAIVDYCRARNRALRTIVPLEDRKEVRAILETLAGPVTLEPEMEAWREDLTRLVQATLDYLPARYGDVLEWKYVDGLSVNEIAERLRTSSKAAESLLTRARQAFRIAMISMSDVSDPLVRPTSG